MVIVCFSIGYEIDFMKIRQKFMSLSNLVYDSKQDLYAAQHDSISLIFEWFPFDDANLKEVLAKQKLFPNDIKL